MHNYADLSEPLCFPIAVPFPFSISPLSRNLAQLTIYTSSCHVSSSLPYHPASLPQIFLLSRCGAPLSGVWGASAWTLFLWSLQRLKMLSTPPHKPSPIQTSIHVPPRAFLSTCSISPWPQILYKVFISIFRLSHPLLLYHFPLSFSTTPLPITLPILPIL